MIFPDFEANHRQPVGVQNGPISLANRGWEMLRFSVKLRASGRGMREMPKMRHTLLRLWFKMGTPADGDRLPMVFPDNEENTEQPMGDRNAPFC